MYSEIVLTLIIPTSFALLSYFLGALDGKGATSGALIGIASLFFGGLEAFSVILIFFLSAYVATKVKYGLKLRMGVAQLKMGRRGLWNVLGNGLFPTIFISLRPLIGDLALVSFSASVSSATSDTLSSEIGVLSKERPRLITTLEKVEVGEDGAISPLGELFGVLGSLLIAGTSWILFGFGLTNFMQVFLSGIIGSHFDSLLGATLQRRGLIDNNGVNFMSTFLAGLLPLLLNFQ